MNLIQRTNTKHYDVFLNGERLHLIAQSLGEALRKASNLILDESDKITIEAAK